MNQEDEKLSRAWGEVELYANVAWAPQSSDEYITANQRLWSQKRIQDLNARQFREQSVSSEKHENLYNPVKERATPNDCIENSYSEKQVAVSNVIPESRLARYYGNFYYNEERENCYTVDNGESSFIAKLPIQSINDNNNADDLECWMLPEVDYWYQKLTGGNDETCVPSDSFVDPCIVSSSLAVPDNPDGICRDSIEVFPAPSLMRPGVKTVQNNIKKIFKSEEKENDLPTLQTTRQGRNIPGLLLQLDSVYPELKLPLHLSNLTINISFSFFTYDNISPKDRETDPLRCGITNAVYNPTLETKEEKILSAKVYGKAAQNAWKFNQYLLFDHKGKPLTPIFSITPSLTLALEKSLQNFKTHMKNFYSSDQVNKQKKPTPIHSQSRKIIQSRHKHKAPRIQSAMKSNLLNVEAPEFFPNSPAIKRHHNAIRSGLCELFPKALSQNNLLKTMNVPRSNTTFPSAAVPIVSNAHCALKNLPIPKNITGPEIMQQKLYYSNLISVYQHTIICCRQNQMITKTDVSDSSIHYPGKIQDVATQVVHLMFPFQTHQVLFGHQNTIPVYQKPPDTYTGRQPKIPQTTTFNIVKNHTATKNNNLILLTNSKKNKLKDSSKARSLENIKLSSQTQQSVDSQADKTNKDCLTVEKQCNNYLESLFNQKLLGKQTNLSRNSSFGSNSSLSKRLDQLHNEKINNAKGQTKIFSSESGISDKQTNPLSYPRRRKKDSKISKIEMESNMTNKPITLLKKTANSPTNFKKNEVSNPSYCLLKSSPKCDAAPPRKGASPVFDCSPLTICVLEQTSCANSPKAKCSVSVGGNNSNKQCSANDPELIKCNKFSSVDHIQTKNPNNKQNFNGSRKKKLQGPTVTEVPAVTSRRRLYSAVLSNSPKEQHVAGSLSCDKFTPKIPSQDSDTNIGNKSSKADTQIKAVYSVPGNQSFCSSAETICSADAHYDKLEREALEQYKVSDESINRKLEELEQQAIDQYSGTSASNMSCGECSSQHKLKSTEHISNEKHTSSKSISQTPVTIDSVVIYSTTASTNNNVNKKTDNFKKTGTRIANKQNKKSQSFTKTSPKAGKTEGPRKKGYK